MIEIVKKIFCINCTYYLISNCTYYLISNSSCFSRNKNEKNIVWILAPLHSLFVVNPLPNKKTKIKISKDIIYITCLKYILL